MPFVLCEMKGMVDILYLIGVYRCQHESLYLLLFQNQLDDALPVKEEWHITVLT